MKKIVALGAPLLLLLNSCTQKDEPLGLLPKDERAPQFDRVSDFLDLGGVFYAYIDLTNEAEALGETLNEIMGAVSSEIPELPPLPLDFAKALEAAGFSGLDAIGLSSRSLEEDLFHNRSILFFPEGVTGFFQFFGDTPHPFDSVDLAPATADLVFEMSYRPEELRETITDIAGAIAGPLGRGGIAAQLQSPLPELGNRTLNELIESAGNRAMVILDFDPDEPLPIGPLGTVPHTDFLIAFDGVTDLLKSARPALEAQREVEWVDTANGFEIRSTQTFPPPFDYLQPVIVADTQTQRVFAATNRAFLDDCLQNANKLKTTEAFRKAANLLPPEGVYFSYLSPQYSEAVLSVMTSALQSSPMAQPQLLKILEMIIPTNSQPIASVSTVGPEGIYTASNMNYSHRTTLASVAIQPLVLVAGVTSAMAIPSFQKVRSVSKEKTILNNLRQIASAGQQYMLEEGVVKAEYNDLVQEYFPTIVPVDGEVYTDLVVHARGGTLSVTTLSGETVEYRY